MTKKEEYKLKHLIKIIKTKPIKMFCDYQNECYFLYDDIDIDINTINFINEYFKFYDVDVKYFYDDFRNTLKLILPRFYQMLKIEINNDITKIYNNIKFRRLCTAKTDDAINKKLRKDDKTLNYEEETKNNTKTTSTETNEQTEKNANKQNPLSNVAINFNDLFEWETSTEINETRNNEENTNNETSDDTTNRNYEQKELNNYYDNLRKIEKGLKDDEEITTEINNLIVENINKIVDYLFKNNKSSDYLINNLKKCFIGIYYYN